MNEVSLKGTLHETPGPQAVGAGKEAQIWLYVDGRWLPVLCRGPAVDAVSQCRSGAQLEIQGFLEYVQTEPGKGTLRVIATKVERPSSQVHSGATKRKSSRRTDWYEDGGYEDLLVEISPGLYWDPIDHEYVGNPDGPDYGESFLDSEDLDDDWDEEAIEF